MSEAAPVRRGPDAVTVLTVYVFLMLAVPALLTFGPLGDAGRPARLFGLVLLGWWGLDYVLRPMVPRVRSAVRVGMIAFAFAMGTSYLAAASRPIADIEVSASDRMLLAVLSWLGAFLVAADGIRSRERLYVLLDRLAMGVGLFATLGILQTITSMPIIDWIDIPGLVWRVTELSVSTRNGYSRAAATAIHPIEYGAVLGLGVAIALHLAIDVRRHGLIRRWFPPVAIGLAIGLSGSRSAFVTAGVAGLLMLPTWDRKIRHNMYVALAVVLAAFVVTAPSFMRTMFSLFAVTGTDDSTTSRTDSYDLVFLLVSRYPFFGRGLGTFLPEYRILDNQYLGTLIEGGVVGLLGLLMVLIGGVATGQALRRAAPDHATRQLGRALSASIAATALSWVFYDGLSFPINAGLAFLILGIIAAARQLQVTGGEGWILDSEVEPSGAADVAAPALADREPAEI